MEICEICNREYVYVRGKSCTKTRCNTCYVAGNRKDRKKLAIELFGGGCQKCGYNKCQRALQFHHVDPSIKEFGLSVGHTISWERYVKELNKCVLLCSICHIELHDGLWNISEISRIVLGQDVFNLVIPTGRASNKSVRYERKCRVCQKPFNVKLSSKRMFCSNACHKISTRRCEWPSKEQLQKELKVNSWVAMGRKYSVSNNAVKKWARAYGLL